MLGPLRGLKNCCVYGKQTQEICSTSLMVREMWLCWWLRQSRIHLQWRRPRFSLWVEKIPWRKEWQPTPVFSPGEFHELRSLVGYSSGSLKESDTTEWLTISFLIGEMQITATMRYHLTPVRMDIVKSLQIGNAGDGVEKEQRPYTVGGNVNWCSYYKDEYGGFLKN